MITILKTWFTSLKETLTSLRTTTLVFLYALLLVSFYFFISTREATAWQVFVTYALLLLVPAEFFVFQAAILDFAGQRKFGLKPVLLSALKLFLVTIPVVLIGAFLWWLMNKLQLRYLPPPAPVVFAPNPPRPQPVHWRPMLITTLRFVVFGVAFPLATIHLWIEASVCDVRASFASGVKKIFGTIGRALARAFSSEAVFVYGLGLILFVLGPYLFLFVPVHMKGTKTDFAVFILRLLLAFIFTFVGWVVTVSTLLRTNATTETVAVNAPATVAESPA
jgi:hypothetical protein